MWAIYYTRIMYIDTRGIAFVRGKKNENVNNIKTNR